MMNHEISRRGFFKASCGVVAAAGTAGLFHRSAIAAEKRSRLPVGCRDVNLKLMGQPDCWSAMKLTGAECVEAVIREDLSLPDLFHPQRKYSAATAEGIQELAADLKAARRRITALCMFNQFEKRPEVEIQWGAKVARVAEALGAKVIRIDLRAEKLPGDEFLRFSIDILKKLMAATESTGVAFGIENHGATTNDPQFLGRLFAGVASQRLGLTLDIGNFYWFGHPLSKLYAICEEFAPRVFHTHCKSIRYPEDQRETQRPMGWEYAQRRCPLYEGDIDYGRVVKILRSAGYSGDLCVEDESLARFPAEERPMVLTKEIAMLKALG